MYCKKCGTDNPDGAVYCRNCGYELGSAKKSTAPSAPAPNRPASSGARPADDYVDSYSYYGRESRSASRSAGGRDHAAAGNERSLGTWAYYGLSLLYGLAIINIFTGLTLIAFYAGGGSGVMNQAYRVYGYDSTINGALDSAVGFIVLLWMVTIIGFIGFVMMVLFSLRIVKNEALIRFSRGSLLKWLTVVIILIVSTVIFAARVQNGAYTW